MVPLPWTDELMRVSGGATNWCVSEPVSVTARVCIFYDVPNRTVIKGKLHSYFSPENDACIVKRFMESAEKELITQ